MATVIIFIVYTDIHTYKPQWVTISCIYSMVIASWSIYVILTLGQQAFRVKYLMGLPPKLKLLAVFSSSDTVVGTYTVRNVV